MNHVVEFLPLRQHLHVVFEHRPCLGIAVAFLIEDGNEVGEDQRVDAQGLPFGMDGNEQQLYFLSVTELEGTEQVIPSEGEQASASFL